MIKFFRQIRYKLMSESKTGKPALPAGRYLKYAIGEIVLVVIGILIALSINNWNENRKERLLEQSLLKSLQLDLRLDVTEIDLAIKDRKELIESFTTGLEILTTDNDASKAQFMDSFEWILAIGGISLNRTAFNNLQSSGQISFIKNKVILDSIINYYNADVINWESAMHDYTRNIIAPYLLEFDYIPHHEDTTRNERLAKLFNPDSYINPGRSLEDYKQSYFIINTLRQKIFNMEGLIWQYEILLKKAKSLDKVIQTYLDDQ